jgi:acyl-CoA thioesterase
MTGLAEALAIRPKSETEWLALADPGYEARNAMFGGWTAAVVLNAVVATATTSARPSTLTVNYIDRVDPGTEVLIRSHRIGGGRSIEHWRAELTTLDDRPLAQALVILTSRRPTDGHTEPSMPEVPDPETVDVFHPPDPAGQHLEERRIAGFPPFNLEATASLSWVREMSGRPVDHLQLAYLADAYAPRCWFWSEDRRPNATLTLSVYFHGHDEEVAAVGDDYVLNEAIGTRGTESTSGEQARLWSRQGVLLATTEQLAWYR